MPKKPPKKPYDRYPSQTKSAFFGQIRSSLRRIWMYSANRRTALNQARRLNKSGVRRIKYEYQCELCESWFFGTDVAVDHIIPCGSLKEFHDMPSFCDRLFCLPDGLRVLCKECHKEVTRAEAFKEHIEDNTFFLKDMEL